MGFPLVGARVVLIMVDSPAGSSAVAAHGLSGSCTWDLPRLGIQPVSPTLAGRFFTMEPPGKPLVLSLLKVPLASAVSELFTAEQ